MIAASASDGEIDQLVPILDEYLYKSTGVAHAATALALKCYCRTKASATGYHRNTVAAHRIALGLNTETLGELAGIGKGALSSIELLGATPSVSVQQSLARALKCTVAELWPEI